MNEEDLMPNQLEVVSKLYPRVQYLMGKGLTEKQVVDTLAVGEGWPMGAVQATMSRVKRSRPNRSNAT